MNGVLASSLTGINAAVVASRAAADCAFEAASLSCGGYSSVPDNFLPESSIELPETFAVKVRALRFFESAEAFRLAGPGRGDSSSPGGVGAPPSGTGGSDDSDDGKLRSKIRDVLESLVAEDDFFEDIDGDELSAKIEELVGMAVWKYKLIMMSEYGTTTPEHAARAAIAAMKSEARDADYDRYCQEVEEGRISNSVIPPATHGGPVERYQFASRCSNNALGIYRKFRRIKTLGMWPDKRVSFIDGTDDRAYRVVAIAANCCVTVKREGGSKLRGGLSPFRLAPIE